MEWAFGLCDTGHSASAARVKCSQIASKAPPSRAVCRCNPTRTSIRYYETENATDEVLRAVRKVLAGELYFSDRVAAAAVQRTFRDKPIGSRIGVESLSDREMQVFQFLGASYNAREIAEQFHLSRKTVETHCEKIKHKLNLKNAAELKEFARKRCAENLMPSDPWTASQSQKSQTEN